MIESVIRIEKPEHIAGTEQARLDFATVTGKELVLKPASFLHIPTGQHYCNIIGGIAYPIAVNQEIRPGIIIIIGVQNEPELKFRVFESYEDENIFNLIEKAIEARKKYGFGLDTRILPNFLGDQEKYQAIIIKTSEVLEKKNGYDRGLYIKDLVDLRERHSSPLYVRQIFNALKTKTLDLNEDKNLIVHLQSFQREDAEKGKTEDFPAIGLLGGMVHGLQIEKPWLEATDGHGTAFNIDI